MMEIRTLKKLCEMKDSWDETIYGEEEKEDFLRSRWVSVESILERLDKTKEIPENSEDLEEAWSQIRDFLYDLEKELRGIMEIDENTFSTEPIEKCPICRGNMRADWVDIGFGPYSAQAGPFHCKECGYVETGCVADECTKQKCTAWRYCQGKSKEKMDEVRKSIGVDE